MVNKKSRNSMHDVSQGGSPHAHLIVLITSDCANGHDKLACVYGYLECLWIIHRPGVLIVLNSM